MSEIKNAPTPPVEEGDGSPAKTVEITEEQREMMSKLIDWQARQQLAFLITGDRQTAENGEWKPDYLAKIDQAINQGQYTDHSTGKTVSLNWKSQKAWLSLDFMKWMTKSFEDKSGLDQD